MTKEEKIISALSDEELFTLSLQKDRKGNATKKALIAQKIIYQKAGCPFQSEAHYQRDNEPVRTI